MVQFAHFILPISSQKYIIIPLCATLLFPQFVYIPLSMFPNRNSERVQSKNMTHEWAFS